MFSVITNISNKKTLTQTLHTVVFDIDSSFSLEYIMKRPVFHVVRMQTQLRPS